MIRFNAFLLATLILGISTGCDISKPTNSASDSKIDIVNDSFRLVTSSIDSFGLRRDYYSNKRLKSITTYLHGEEDGIQTHYYKNSWQLRSVGHVQNGKTIGNSVGFFENGRHSIDILTIDSSLTESMTYFSDGRFNQYQIYFNDHMIYRAVYDSLRPCVELEQGDQVSVIKPINSDSLKVVYGRAPYYDYGYSITQLEGGGCPTTALRYTTFPEEGKFTYKIALEDSLLDYAHLNIVLRRISLVCRDTSYFCSGKIVLPASK